MNPVPPLEQAQLEELLADHHEVIRLANELEYCLYRLGEIQGEERVTACQQAGGTLIGRLRTLLFRHDQTVFPLLHEAAEARDSNS
jgi:hypothetical protein